MWAAFKNNREIVKILLNSGANIDRQSNDGDTALIKAAFKNNHNIIELLLSKGADKSILNKEGKSYYDYLDSENKKIFNK
jgi:ankyrin repeat protein